MFRARCAPDVDLLDKQDLIVTELFLKALGQVGAMIDAQLAPGVPTICEAAERVFLDRLLRRAEAACDVGEALSAGDVTSSFFVPVDVQSAAAVLGLLSCIIELIPRPPRA
jgi:hypothetical protein